MQSANKPANMATLTRATNGWTKEHIQELLVKNDKALMRGLLQIYARQTTDEKQAQNTKYHNSVGFSGADGKVLTSLAQNLLKFNRLSDKQLALARCKMGKYWKQLLEIAADSPKGPTFTVAEKKPSNGILFN